MKYGVFGLLLAAAAGLIGLVSGALLVAFIAVFWMYLGPSTPSPTADTLVNIAGFAIPVLGGLAGIAIGWVALMREPERDRRRAGATARCQHCNYDLHHNTTGRCPECGRAIPAKQQRYLRQ